MAEKEIAIKVENLTKTFHIPIEAHNGIKQKLINTLKGRKGFREFTPLRNISFEIEKGDFFGIVGRNGSGKSTLLKSLAGIYTPNGGSVYINGTLVPFIELGVGFNPELTGRENVYLNGALLGFSHKQMEKMYDDIVEFAELEDFMEERLKNYSSGMQVRLAFSIAIRAEGDILLLDEVLAVGDEAFQRKCYDYFGELKRKGKTVILVSHSMSAVEQFCDKAMLIEDGEIKKIGSSVEVASLYSNLFLDQYKTDNKRANKKRQEEAEDEIRSKNIFIENVDIAQNGKSTDIIEAYKPFEVRVAIKSKVDIKDAILGINIVNSRNHIVLATGVGTKHDKHFSVHKGRSTVTFKIRQNIYTDDSYYINIAIAKGSGGQSLVLKERELYRFSISGVRSRKHSMTHPEIDVDIA